MVFYYSLKDKRSIAPHKSCGSRAGQTRPTALTIPIRATQPDIAFRCCWAYLPVRTSATEIFRKNSRYRLQQCADMRKQSRFYAQET